MFPLPELAIIPLLLFIFFLHKWLSVNPRKNLPPSPRKLPIIGNFHQLGTSPHRSLQVLSTLYGPLMLIHIGLVPVLVASTAEAAREILKNQDAIFSSRPRLSIGQRLTYGSRDVGFSPYGEYWRQVRSIIVVHVLSNTRVRSYLLQVRSIIVVHVLSNTRVRSYGRVREEETSAMVEKIRRLALSSEVVNLSDLLASLSIDVVCRVALGRKYGEEREFNKLLSEFGELLGTTCFGDYIPWLGWIIDRANNLDARIESVAKQFDEFLENVIQEHKDDEKERKHGGDGEMDLVDIMLEFQRENQNTSPFEDDTIKAVILDMFAAGTDTSTLTMQWAMTELIKNPRAMKTLANEVRQVAGAKKEVDTEQMPYLKAVIKETLRLHVPVPMLIPRESTQDTRVLGYEISAGTQVLINAWAIGRDPSLWENSEEFCPERFLGWPGVDFRGLHFEYLPFGGGRRGCPGIAFGLAVVEIGLANLVNNFDFSLADGGRGEDLDMSETSGITVHKKLPLLLLADVRT